MRRRVSLAARETFRSFALPNFRLFFIGQFICPLLVLALTGAFDSLGAAILVLGAVSVAAAVGVRLIRPTQSAEPALLGH